MRYLKSLWQFIKYQAWVDCPDWKAEDAIALKRFLASETGVRFKATMLNAVLRQQSSAVVSENNVDRAIGYANGFRGCVSFVESLTEVGQDEAD